MLAIEEGYSEFKCQLLTVDLQTGTGFTNLETVSNLIKYYYSQQQPHIKDTKFPVEEGYSKFMLKNTHCQNL